MSETGVDGTSPCCGVIVAPRQVIVTVFREPGGEERWTRTVTVTLEGLDAESQEALFGRGFMFAGDSAVMEVAADNEERMYHALVELERWILKWTEQQHLEPVFRWRVGR